MASGLEAGAEFVQSWLTSAHFKDAPGGIVSVSVEGELVFDQAFGIANQDSGEQMRADMQFQIASQSKVFTATAIMQLQERRLLSVEDPIGVHMPELKGSADPRTSTVTIEQLLTHTSGFARDGSSANFWETNAPFPDQDELIDTLLKERLALPPSTQMKYSNLGYAALGTVIQRVSSQTYEDFIHKNILTPLDLENTSIRVPTKTSNVPIAYGSLANEERAALPLADTRSFASATGLFSTTKDLLRFFAELNETPRIPSAILTTESIRAMNTARAKALYSGGVEYGLGIDIGSDGDVKIVGHGGGFPGHRSGTIVDAKNNIIVSAFTNAIDIDAFGASIDIARVMRYFIQNGDVPDIHRQSFNITAESIWRKRRLVAVGNKVLSIYPGSYTPFSETSAEILTPISSERLVITQANSFDGAGEDVLLPKENPDIIIYGGRRLKITRSEDYPFS